MLPPFERLPDASANAPVLVWGGSLIKVSASEGFEVGESGAEVSVSIDPRSESLENNESCIEVSVSVDS